MAYIKRLPCLEASVQYVWLLGEAKMLGGAVAILVLLVHHGIAVVCSAPGKNFLYILQKLDTKILSRKIANN